MEGATLLCTRDSGWEVKFKGPVPANQLVVPVGVFLGRVNTRYHPTTHSYGRNEFYSGKVEVGLVRESYALNAPLTLTVAGQNSVILTNTGRAALRVGSNFTLEYPTPDDSRAQEECIKMGHTRHQHPRLDESAPLWGSMLATVSAANRWESVKMRVADEVAAGATAFLYSLGSLMSQTRAAAQHVALTYYNAVTAGQAVNAAQVTTNANAVLADIVESVQRAEALLYNYRPKVSGVVQRAVQGSSDAIATGAQFHAFITVH